MNKKIVFNYRLAQEQGQKDTRSKVVRQPADDLPSILSTEDEKELFIKLEAEANDMSGPNARSDFFSNTELALQYTQLYNSHKRIIDNILLGKSSSSLNSDLDNQSSGYNNSKNKAKAYEPYLQKINDSPNGNNLLYLAAISSFGFPADKGKNVDYLYTEDNKDRIIKRLNDITSNHYIQTKFSNIPNQLSDAIERLNAKIQKKSPEGGSSKSSPVNSGESNNTVNAPGSGTSTFNPYPGSEIGVVPGDQPTTFNSDEDNFSNEARTILDEIDDLEKISKSDVEKFKQQWPYLYKEIWVELQTAKSNNKINIAEESDIKTKLTNLDNDWIGIFYPGGFKRLGNGTIIPLDIEEATIQLLEQIKINKDNKQVKKLAEIYQKAFLNKQSTKSSFYTDKLKIINNAILIRNADPLFEDNIPIISMSEYR